ncbi:c-type cytochrome [Caldimonas sp. KR1-144]|uniref:c-type cytochrome n=1 Tax=Caldimonas sp. KR1-144 TaxID=3400911 RepID=UPI003C0148E8
MKALFAATTAVLAIAFGPVTYAQDKPAGGDAAAGAKKVAMCIGCHGIPGYQSSFPEVHKVPMIAGQNAKYIVAALGAYKKGERKHPTMRGIADTLSEQDMADVAAYYENQGGAHAELPKEPAAPNAQVAELLKKGNCAACHGANLSTPIDPSYPKLSGQHADYLYVALKSYQTEKNPQIGRGNAIMAAQAKPFSHAELKALANYIASLPGDLKTVPQSKFR